MLKKGASLVATRFLHLSFFFVSLSMYFVVQWFFHIRLQDFFSTYAYLLCLYQLNVFCHGLFILTAGCKKYLPLLRILRFCITSLILPMFFIFWLQVARTFCHASLTFVSDCFSIILHCFAMVLFFSIANKLNYVDFARNPVVFANYHSKTM